MILSCVIPNREGSELIYLRLYLKHKLKEEISGFSESNGKGLHREEVFPVFSPSALRQGPLGGSKGCILTGEKRNP